jgi:hypothetical protein
MMAPDPSSVEKIVRQQTTGDGSGKGGRWLAREYQQSHSNNKGQQRERAVDDRVGG